jgi:hypothetical protein
MANAILQRKTRALAKKFALAALAMGSLAPVAQAETVPCSTTRFELSESCIAERGLEKQAALFKDKIKDAMFALGASYKIDLRVVTTPALGPYTSAPQGDVWLDVVRDADMRHSSFIASVTAHFLATQPEILFEAAARHEVCHIINDDLPGYRRQKENVEAAEEKCVLNAVGEPRYREYLQAYARYKDWNNAQFEAVLKKVKNLTLIPPPGMVDEADRQAAEFFKNNANGKEHLLVYNGELHNITLASTRDTVSHDPRKLAAIIAAGKPMIFIHNHPDDGRAAAFPSYDDFGVAGLFSFMVYRENPDIAVEFRVMKPGQESTNVAYGFRNSTIAEIKTLASDYRNAATRGKDTAPIIMKQKLQNYHLARESYNTYLQYACPIDLGRKEPEKCATHPQNFIWPNDRFFIQNRPQ